MSKERAEKAPPPEAEEDSGLAGYLMGEDGAGWVWLLALLLAG